MSDQSCNRGPKKEFCTTWLLFKAKLSSFSKRFVFTWFAIV